MRASYLFTSESVSEGHPDKVCDRISDEIVDLFYREGPKAGIDPWQIRAACETLATTNKVVIAGETRGPSSVTNEQIEGVVRSAIKDIGYEQDGFHWKTCDIEILLHPQSADIAQGVDALQPGEVKEEGAGDQGIMFGYATDETPAYMPMPIYLAHRLSERLTAVRRAENTPMPYLLPDGKTQVTIGYAPGHVPTTVEAVVVSTQHHEWVTQEQLRADVEEHVIRPVIERSGLDTSGMRIIINPGGKFVIGGPVGDAGLTGRKIIVDTYGGMARHGGGAFSGKDPSKVDRSAAYMLRWVAKNVVAAGLASRAEFQVAYAIGKARPVGVYVDTFGTETVDPARIESAVEEVFDLRPLAIIEDLQLQRPIYAKTSAGGHFGRQDPDFTWEKTDRVDALRSAVGA